MTKLLTLNTAKIAKTATSEYMQAVMYLAPYNKSGVNLCAMAELANCHGPCLATSGRLGISKAQGAQAFRAQWFNNNRETFFIKLQIELESFILKANRAGKKPCVRLNGTSDIMYENITVRTLPITGKRTIFDLFPEIQFWDYTKIAKRLKHNTPNYHLVFSYSTAPGYQRFVKQALETECNIAVVFEKYLPDTFLNRPVINGDKSDLRFLDGKNKIIGLLAKGRAKEDPGSLVVMQP